MRLTQNGGSGLAAALSFRPDPPIRAEQIFAPLGGAHSGG